MNRHSAPLLSLLLAGVVSAYGLGLRPPDTQTTKAPTKKSQSAKWNDDWQTYHGISQQDFQNMGLGKLTPLEAAIVYLRLTTLAEQARAKARNEWGYTCGRNRTDVRASDYERVRLFAEFDEDPPEIASGIRHRLRQMTDIEIVYTEKEADLTISFITYEDKLTGGRPIGYTISLITTQPCIGKFGSYSEPFRMLQNHFLQSHPNIDSLVDSVVSSLDNKDIEQVRKMNSALKKFYEQKQ